MRAIIQQLLVDKAIALLVDRYSTDRMEVMVALEVTSPAVAL